MKSYLERRRSEFISRGTMYMVPIIDEILGMNITTSGDLHMIVEKCLKERNTHDKFDLNFQYYWSMHTMLTDIEAGYRRLDKEKEDVNVKSI